MGVYVHDTNWASRRMIAFIAMVLFHILLFWALKNGFAIKLMEAMAPPIVADIVQEEVKDDKPPPPPPPKMELPPVEVPPPVVDISIPVESTTTALSNVTDKPAPPPAPAVAAPTVRTALKVNPRSSQPNVDDYYPETSRRLEEEGVAKIRACVGSNGKVKTATLEDSSGFPRLDEAGIKVAKLLRFTPPTVNGQAVDDECGTVPIRFKLPKN
jgi:periplasmic protein TonB